MDWSSMAREASAWGEKMAKEASAAADKASSKLQEVAEQAKVRVQPPIQVGPYRVSKVKKLADGGFSEVFLAQDASGGDEQFALKRKRLQQRRTEVMSPRLRDADPSPDEVAFVLDAADTTVPSVSAGSEGLSSDGSDHGVRNYTLEINGDSM